MTARLLSLMGREEFSSLAPFTIQEAHMRLKLKPFSLTFPFNIFRENVLTNETMYVIMNA